jgi:peptidoglycan-associated lipoprotein
MKHTKLFNLLMMLGLVLTFATVGCKKQPLGPTPIPGLTHKPGDETGLAPSNPVDTNGGPMGVSSNGNIAVTDPSIYSTYAAHPEILQAQTIYFDYDKSAIKSSEQGKLGEVANYLKSNPSQAVRVEGNCDERGTEEYNRSLGERRALGAREYLVQLGVDPIRVVTITYGEDKPADSGHNEAAWSKNRRDDFVVLTPP